MYKNDLAEGMLENPEGVLKYYDLFSWWGLKTFWWDRFVITFMPVVALLDFVIKVSEDSY